MYIYIISTRQQNLPVRKSCSDYWEVVGVTGCARHHMQRYSIQSRGLIKFAMP